MGELRAKLGIKSKKKPTTLRMYQENEKKTLEIEQGSFSSKEPWYVQDVDSNRAYVMLSKEQLATLLGALKKAQEESFKLSLERDIFQQMPIDFEDVWTVAIAEAQKYSTKTLSSISTKDLVRTIKHEHPNLFFEINDLFSHGGE